MIGTGYVGLVTGTCFAEVGNDVLCLDVDARKIAILNGGGVPIHEPGLEAMIRRNVEAGRLRFTTDVDLAVRHGTLQFIAVGTPPGEDGSADMQYVIEAARNIGRRMTDWKIVVDKSTVPVGTADRVRDAIREELGRRGVDVPFAVVSNPEFLKEGAAVEDFMKPDRVVIGADDERAVQALRAVYAPFQRSHDRVMVMDVRSAELTKYAANAMLATRISFMNELANLADRLGADIESVRKGIGSDPRIGWHFLYPGVGYGGSCFPKDVQALAALGRECGVRMRVAEAAHLANKEQALFLARLVRAALRGSLKGKHVALWGLAFKPETDDIRESPAVKLAEALLDQGATVCGNDPEAGENFATRFGTRLGVTTSALEALQGAHALVLLTEWRCYRSPNWAEVRKRMLDIDGTEPVVVDARNIWRAADVGAASLRYQGIGTRG